MAKRGPPLTKIDWKKVNAMCQIQCTGEEIAGVLDMDYDTLQNACKREHKIKFSEYIAKKRQGGKASLRRNQWKLAESGNSTMLIWLGKQYLGQSDKVDSTENTEIKGVINIIRPDDDGSQVNDPAR